MAAMLALGASAALPVFAQSDTQRIEITGSNIRRLQAETAAPVNIISGIEIQNSGKASLGEYLQTLAVDGQGSVPPSFTNGFATGSIGISLRGLGASSTLVLLNGRRMAPYGMADDGQKIFTDLSSIPVDAVERVEILKDGSSAVYGSDAIAGVVNIILRRSYNGIQARASYGQSRYSDGKQAKAAIMGGFGDLTNDRWNVFFNFEATKSDSIRNSERDRDWIGTSDTRRWGYAQGGSFFTPGGAITGTGNTAAGSSLTGAVRVGTAYQSLPGCGQVGPTLTPADPQGGCLVDAQKLYGYLMPEIKSVNLFTRGTFQIGNDHEVYAELSAMNKKSSSATTPSGVSGSWGYPGGPVNASAGAGAVVLAPTHPDNVTGGDRLRYLAYDVGPRTSDVDNKFYRILVGAKGSSWGWDYDTALMHSETDLTQSRNGYLRYSVVRSALGDPTSQYFPWRVGLNARLNSPALYAALSPTISSDGTSKLTMFDAKATHDLAQLSGGALAIALGAEFRRESSALTPTTYTDIGDIIGLGYSAFDGTRNLSAVYAELNAPILKSLEANAAVRYDRYSGGLHATTPKVGLKWTPVTQFALRGTYAEGFRAPNAAEGGNGGVAAFATASDPVRCPGGVQNPAGAGDCNVQLASITTGNPGLQPEKSKSWTLGFVFEPITNTSVTLDFWKIKRENEINQPTVVSSIAAGNVLRSDNNLPGIPNSGTLLAAFGGYINSASSTIEGFDIEARARFGFGAAGNLTAKLGLTHIESWKRIETDGTTFEFAGTHGNCDVSNCIGTPKNRANLSATWDRNPWAFTATVNYIGSMRNEAFEGDGCASHFADGSEAPGRCRIPSFTTLDISGRWDITRQLQVFGSIQNLFDKVAPLDPTTYGAVNFNPMHVSGAIGRFYTLGLRYTFQ